MTGTGIRPLCALALAAGLLALPPGAGAQGLTSQSGDTPVTINADDGIEWIREEKKYTARGNAKATRDGATIHADLLTAFYRDKDSDKGQDIFRVDADGNVRITANGNEARGDKGVYYADKAVFVLVGKDLRLRSDQGVLTARDSLEYWDTRRLAVARGEATVVQENQRMRADVLTAHIADPNDPAQKKAKSAPARKKQPDRAKSADGAPIADDGGQIEKIDAFGNVHISLQNAVIRGDNGVYVPSKGVATICGNVRVTSGKNQLNGKCAEVNLKTGIYRLTGRAKGLVLPQQKDR